MKMSLWLILGVGLSIGLLAQPVSTPPPAAATAAEAPTTAAPAAAAPSDAGAPASKPKKKTTKNKAPKKVSEKKSAAAKAPAGLRTVPLVPGPATVVASNVNVRGKSRLKSEVVTRVTKGQEVMVLEEIVLNNTGPDEPSAWAKIALPQGTPVWVHSSFLDPNTRSVIPKRLNLRSGPGENYSILGRLERGEAVKELSTKGPWMEIEAPTNAYAFIAAQYLKQEAPATAVASTAPTTTTPETPPATTPAAPATPATPPEPAPTISTVTEATVVAAAPTEAPAPAAAPAATNVPPAETPVVAAPISAPEATNALASTEEPPKKRIVMREGYVRGTGSIQAPTHFSLVSADSSRMMIDYLYSPTVELDLRRYKGLHVIVTGEESLEERWGNTPILTIQDIKVLED